MLNVDDYDDYGDYNARQLARYPNFHHSSPLTLYPQKLVKEFYEKIGADREVRLVSNLVSDIHKLNNQSGITHELIVDPSEIYSYVFSITTRRSYDKKDEKNVLVLERLFKIAFREVIADMNAVASAHSGLGDFGIRWGAMGEISADLLREMSTLVSMRSFFIHIRNMVQQRHLSATTKISEKMIFRDLIVFVQKELLLIKIIDSSDKIYLLNYDQWLMLTDTISCRFMTRLACLLNDRLQTDRLPDWITVSEIYRWGDDMIKTEGQAAYAVIGEFEAFITGAFVTFQGSDPLHLGHDFLRAIYVSAEETYALHRVPVSWTDLIMDILKRITSVNWLSEIFGLRKHWGNPLVDAAASGESVQEKMSEDIPISPYHSLKLVSSFNRMITKEFIKKHGQWPECSFAESEGGVYPLYEAWKSGIVRLPENQSNHSHLHWSLQKFAPNVTLDSYDDPMGLLSDKSVSLHREHLDATYVQSLCNPKFRMRPDECRRLILEFLRKKQHTIMDIFKVVMSGETPISWLANSAAMKGTEMKYEKARIFAVLTYEIRQYFTATEDIIKNELFKYNPHQTMTMSEPELLKKLKRITRQMDPEGSSRELSVVHIIDFSKWNLRMKYDNTCLVFKSIDDFLGTPGLIENTHILFSGMLNIVQDAFNPPPEGVQATESSTVWRNHNAGWEGQRQKGWTLLTSALLSDLERSTGVRSEICGQGDNQVLLSSFPIPPTYRNPSDWINNDSVNVKLILDAFYNELENECISIGLKVKTAETCRSLYYLNYGKRLYFNGIELSMMLKRISKSITEPNNTYPTTESLLKTEVGASFGAGLYSHPSILPFFLSRFSLLMSLHECFTKNPLLKDFGKRKTLSRGIEYNSSFLSILAKIPSILGGPPQLSFASYLYRGHPDPACSDIIMLTLRARNGCEASKRMIYRMEECRWFNKENRNDRRSLIMSPYSFNLKLPKSALSPITDTLLPAIDTFCDNPDINDLFRSDMSSHETDILEFLSKLQPFQPLIANDIYGRTLPGRRQTLLSGLSNTTSLGRIIYESRMKPIISDVAELEMRQIEFWIGYVYDVQTCGTPEVGGWCNPHHFLVQQARNKSWDCEVVGVTVPHPLEQFSLTKVQYDICDGKCKHLLPEHIVMVRHSEDLVGPPGSDILHVTTRRSRSGNPYLGNTIHEGITQRSLYCMNPTAPWIDAVRLNVVRRWVAEENSMLDKYLVRLISSRTNSPLEVLDAATGKPSRLSYSHRASLMAVVNSCAISSTSNMHSRIYVSSDRLGVFSHGDFNYHMPLGPAFLLYQSLISLQEVMSFNRSWSSVSREIYHIHIRSNDVPMVFDGKLEVSTSTLPSPYIPRVPILLFCDYTKLEFSDNTFSYDTPILINMNQATLEECKDGYATQLIGNSLVSEIVVRETISTQHFQNFLRRDSPVSIGDVRLVGVARFVSVLSQNIYLLLPYTTLFEEERCSFQLMVALFIGAFTSSFWEQYSTALSALSNLRILVNRMSGFSDKHLTKSSIGAVALLKSCIIEETWLIHESIIRNLQLLNDDFCFNLYVASVESAKYCWSKFVEAVLCRLCKNSHLSNHEIIGICRDFSSNIHSLDSRYFSAISVGIQREFFTLQVKLGSSHPVLLPRVKMFDSKCPWIDRLRYDVDDNHIESDTRTGFDSCLHLTTTPHNAVNATELMILDTSIYTRYTECTCIEISKHDLYHSEFFFCPTGILSKIHYEFLDAVMTKDLDVSFLICLSSPTGSEAFYFAKSESCQQIYVHHTSSLIEYSPHMAGSYVPAAFVGHPEEQKLFNCGKCAIADNDLHYESGFDSIYSHVKPMSATGLTLDLGEWEDYSYSEIWICVQRTLSLLEKLPSVSWILLRVSIKCRHNALSLMGAIAKVFCVVDIEYPLFAAPKKTIFIIIGRKRRTVSIIRQAIDFIETPLTDAIDDKLDQLFLKVSVRRYPWISYLRSSRRIARSVMFSGFESSLKNAFSVYAPGWGHYYEIKPDKASIIAQAKSMCGAIDRSVIEILNSAGKVARDELIMRSSILSLQGGSIYTQINSLYIINNRLRLLLQILELQKINLGQICQLCDNWLTQSHVFSIQGHDFPLTIDNSRFVNLYSRFLFEILGHCSNWECDRSRNEMGPHLFHRIHSGDDYRTISELFKCSYTTSPLNHFDLRWKWQKRSEILLLILSLRIFTGRHVDFYSPHDYVIEDLLKTYSHLNLSVTHVTGKVKFEQSINVLWMNEEDTIDQFHGNLAHEFLVMYKYKDIQSLSLEYHITEIYRIPWSGIVPDIVLCRCETGTGIRSHLPDLLSMAITFSPSGQSFIGCGCIDCAGECSLIQGTHISHYKIDKLCSTAEIESVRDVKH